MGVPTSEVGYTSATARRGNHESSYEHVMALEKKIDELEIHRTIKILWFCLRASKNLKSYQTGTNIIKTEKGTLVTECQKLLTKWRNYVS